MFEPNPNIDARNYELQLLLVCLCFFFVSVRIQILNPSHTPDLSFDRSQLHIQFFSHFIVCHVAEIVSISY